MYLSLNYFSGRRRVICDSWSRPMFGWLAFFFFIFSRFRFARCCCYWLGPSGRATDDRCITLSNKKWPRNYLISHILIIHQMGLLFPKRRLIRSRLFFFFDLLFSPTDSIVDFFGLAHLNSQRWMADVIHTSCFIFCLFVLCYCCRNY